MKTHFRLLADYNRWMNEKIYHAANQLTAMELIENRGAFFGSMQETLGHLVITDIVWLQRFNAKERPFAALSPLRGILLPDLVDTVSAFDMNMLYQRREEVDSIIVSWVEELTDDDLSRTLHYIDDRCRRYELPFSMAILHFFNHQTHHRGQVTTLLTQVGIDVGVTDLLERIPRDA